MIHTFYDWNEIRVSSVRELAEVDGRPTRTGQVAAHRFKRILQSIFEATYAFDLEDLRKLNLGPATERLEQINGTTKFSVAYTVQAGLAGHWIPIDAGTMAALRMVDLVTDADVESGTVPGLERAIHQKRRAWSSARCCTNSAPISSLPLMLRRCMPSCWRSSRRARERLPSRRAKRTQTECPSVSEPTETSSHLSFPGELSAQSGEAPAAGLHLRSEGKPPKSAKRRDTKQENVESGLPQAEPSAVSEEATDKKKHLKKRPDASKADGETTAEEKGPAAKESGTKESPATQVDSTALPDAAPPASEGEPPKRRSLGQSDAAMEPLASKRKGPAKKRPDPLKLNEGSHDDPAKVAAECLSKRKPR